MNNVQRSTINRISQFFGISCDEIEYFDLEKIERKRGKMSVDGNQNPSAVPVIPESAFLNNLDKTIGFLVIKYSLTYAFNHESEVVAMEVESYFCKIFNPGDILIIKRIPVLDASLSELYVTPDNKFKIKNEKRFIDRVNSDIGNNKFVGCIME